MFRIKDIKPLAVFLLSFAYAVVGAQGWEKTFGDIASDVSNDLVQTSDNGWLTVGSSSSFGAGDRDVYLVKTDVDGTLQRHRTFGTPGVEDLANAIFQLSDGSFIIAGTSGNTAATTGSIWTVSSDLLTSNLLYTTDQDSVVLRDLTQTTDGKIVAVGNRGDDIFFIKIDLAGNKIWEDTAGGNDLDNAFAIEALQNSEFLIAGYTNSNLPSVDAFLAKFDSTGTNIWAQNFGNDIAEEQALSMISSQNGGWLLAGFSDSTELNDEEIWLAETDFDGNLIFEKKLPIPGLEKGRSIGQLSDGSLLIAGEQRADMNGDVNAVLVKTDASGNLIWSKTYGGLSTDIANSLQLSGRSIYLSGATSSFGAGSFDSWLLKTDADGTSFSSFLKGNVFADFDLDCEFDTGEVGIEDWLLEVNGNKNYYTSTDASGDYEINVDTGDYTVNLIVPNPYWTPCFTASTVSFTNFYDTITLDFPVKDTIDCSYLTVDVSTPFLRRCFPNAYTVSYCNSGTQTAVNSQVTLDFDAFLTIDSASVSLTALGGNSYSFNVGDLDPFDCGSFKVFTKISCDSMAAAPLLGQTHCTTARIAPDTFCVVPPPNWDGASIELEAFCSDDSIFVKIANTTGSPMANRSEFIIIEDEILTDVIPVDLDGNTDTSFVIFPEGQTVRFEIDQTSGHPGASRPSISVEGCGLNSDGSYSLGYVTQFSQDDGDSFVEIDCQENIGSYDPNDKRGYPKGYESAHFIEDDTELAYHIRFQNTGTDTAFTVVIRDTIAAELDPSSVIPGVSSHPYEFEVYDDGIIKFTFNDILLPDSNRNEVASHGFVRFKISLDESLPNGTVIYNDADIYFDFNAPIITNETFHQIGMDFVVVDTTSSLAPSHDLQTRIKIFPNPFYDQTTIELIDVPPFGEKAFDLFDVAGKLVRVSKFSGKEFIFEKENLQPGIYFFKIKNDQKQIIAAGKIVLQ